MIRFILFKFIYSNLQIMQSHQYVGLEVMIFDFCYLIFDVIMFNGDLIVRVVMQLIGIGTQMHTHKHEDTHAHTRTHVHRMTRQHAHTRTRAPTHTNTCTGLQGCRLLLLNSHYMFLSLFSLYFPLPLPYYSCLFVLF